MGMRLTVTGSGTIIPEAGRACTSLLVETGETRCLIDCGPGVPGNLARNGLSPGDLDRVLITHFHPDHTLGLPHLLSAMKNGWGGPGERRLSVTGPEGTGRLLERLASVWPGLAEGVDLEVSEMRGGGRLLFGGMEVTAAEAEHGDREALSFRVESGGASFVYTGDTGFTEELVQLAFETDMLVSECSFPDEAGATGHMSPSTVSRLASLSAVSEVLLVHIYPFFERDAIVSRVREGLDVPVRSAEDGDIFDLPGL